MVREILLLGHPKLFERCDPVAEDELPEIRALSQDLCDTISDFRGRHGAGRAIAAPQIGVMKRLVVMNAERVVTFINPVFEEKV